MLGSNEGRDGRSRVGDGLQLSIPAISVLPEDSVGEGDISGPVLGIDDEDAAGTDCHVVQVSERASGPVDVVKCEPAVLAESVESLADPSLTLGARGPVPLVALGACERVGDCADRGIAGCLLLPQPLDASCTTRCLLFRAETGFHVAPPFTSARHGGVQW